MHRRDGAHQAPTRLGILYQSLALSDEETGNARRTNAWKADLEKRHIDRTETLREDMNQSSLND